ncbi:MAG: hypothetical protein U1F29_16135 [Planctomycetota bacterium]
MRRQLLALLALAALTGPLAAQVRNPPPITPMPPMVPGGPGDSVVTGSAGSQVIVDVHPNDADFLYDSQPASDGARDVLNATDGDADDVLVGGPEDVFNGDDEDMVIIYARGGKRVLWVGTVKEHRTMRRLIKWTQDSIKRALLAAGNPPPSPDQWLAALETVSIELDDSACGGPTPDMNTCYVLGPYVEGALPASPADYLQWCGPSLEDGAECEGSWIVEEDELLFAIDSVQALLGEAIQAAQVGDDADG